MRCANGSSGVNLSGEDPIRLAAADIAQETWLLCFDELQVTDIADAIDLRPPVQAAVRARGRGGRDLERAAGRGSFGKGSERHGHYLCR